MMETAARRKYLRFKVYGISVFYCITFFIFGCSNNTLKQFTRPDYDISAVKTIAVMPFRNFTADNYADEKIRTKICIDLLSRDLDVIEPGEIISVMRELGIRSVDSIRDKDIVSLGGMLHVDAVITGSVETFGISRGIATSYPEVSVQLFMFETNTGRVVWSTSRTSGGASFWTRHFGAEGDTLDNVSERVIGEAFDALYDR